MKNMQRRRQRVGHLTGDSWVASVLLVSVDWQAHPAVAMTFHAGLQGELTTGTSPGDRTAGELMLQGPPSKCCCCCFLLLPPLWQKFKNKQNWKSL